MSEKLEELKKIRKQKRLVLSSINRSNKALRRNAKKLKNLEREEDYLLTPMLPGLFD